MLNRLRRELRLVESNSEVLDVSSLDRIGNDSRRIRMDGQELVLTATRKLRQNNGFRPDFDHAPGTRRCVHR